MLSLSNVVIADDHPLFRHALSEFLTTLPGIGEVHTAANGREALSLICEHSPELAILDISMPEIDGIQTIVEVKKAKPSLNIMVLSLRTDPGSIQLALQSGASAYLPKEAGLDEIATAVKTVLIGDTYLPASLAHKFALESVKGQCLNTLTRREKEVLKLISQDKTTKQIAGLLGISIRTVERVRNMILQKTGCSTSSGALIYAQRKGLLLD